MIKLFLFKIASILVSSGKIFISETVVIAGPNNLPQLYIILLLMKATNPIVTVFDTVFTYTSAEEPPTIVLESESI